MSVIDSNVNAPSNQQTSAKSNSEYNITNDIAGIANGMGKLQSGKTGLERAQGLGQLIMSIYSMM